MELPETERPPLRPPTAHELWQAVRRQSRPLGSHVLWRARHQALLSLLVLHVLGLGTWMVLAGWSSGHVAGELGGLALLALVGALGASRPGLAASAVSLGLVASAALLVHVGDGRTVLHFHFFLVVAALALYQQWLPFGLALGFVLVDHAVMGAYAPETVYDDAFSMGSPLLAAVVHGGYVLAVAAVCALAWTWAERERRSAEARAEHEARRVRASEGRLSGLLENAPASIFVKSLDGTFASVNAEMVRMLEVPADQLLGRTSGDLFGEDALTSIDAHDAEVVATQRASEREERHLVAGRACTFSVVKFPLLDDGGAVTAVGGIATDVTARRAAEQALELSEARLRQVFARGPVPQMVLQVDGTLVEVNPAFRELFGFSEPELVGMRLQTLVDPADRARVAELLPTQGAGGPEREELRMLTRDGAVLSCLVSLAAVVVDGAAGYCVGMVEDVTEARRSAAELAHQATHDALTGLPNRVLLLDRIAEALVDERRRVAVVFLDLDGFKEVNDSLGHDAGDALLHTVARRLDGVRRAGDTLARLGGDEFVLCCSDVPDATAAHEAAYRMVTALRSPLLVGDRVVEVGGSIGVAVGSAAEGATPMLLLRDADTALYAAKATGRDRVVLFSPEMRDRDERRRRLQADLAVALRNGGAGLRLDFQPVAEAATGRLVSCEALVRWEHPVDGLLMPDAFLQLAADKGLLGMLDRWVLEQACRTAAEWPSHAGPVSVAVNITPQTLVAERVVEWVGDACARSGLPPERLVVELTETAVVERPRETSRALARLRTMGVRVALDDFGTGYSSMSHLRDLPVDVVKIDRSFTAGCAGSARDRAIVRATADLADALGAVLVAEGVEDAEQREAVVAAGCQLLQGWHVSRPLSADVVAALLAAQPVHVPAPPGPRAGEGSVRALRPSAG